jgi:hypothetical protein
MNPELRNTCSVLRAACWVTVRCLMVAALAFVVASATAAGQVPQGSRYALIIQGASGEEQYAKLHRQWATDLGATLRDRFRYGAANVVTIAEQPLAGETRSSADNVKAAVARLAKALTPSDQLMVFFIGHGTTTGGDAKFNLIGPDLTIAEWKALFDQIPAKLVVVDTTSGSFPFLAGLAAKDRIVITATNSPSQQFHTQFPDAFLQALGSTDTDLDKNNRLSVLEIFTQATRIVKQFYEQKGTMATETAVFDDNGDGKGQMAASDGGDGRLAGLTYLDPPAAITTKDPELQKLIARQQALSDQVDELRRKQPLMPAAEFSKQLEALLVELAEVSRDVRRRQTN